MDRFAGAGASSATHDNQHSRVEPIKKACLSQGMWNPRIDITTAWAKLHHA